MYYILCIYYYTEKFLRILIKLHCCAHFPASTHFPGAMLTLPLLLWVLRLMASAWWKQGEWSKSPASWVLPEEEQGVKFLTQGSAWDFYILSWNSTLHMALVYKMSFMYVWCYFCLFVTPETCRTALDQYFCHWQLVTEQLFVALMSPVPDLCLHLLSSLAFTNFTASCAPHTLRPLFQHTRSVFLYSTSLC